ncbi:hypothetical protein PC115_g23304 [Phytophthora cactorum]|uniref:Uncharacterized protein n=1 Tax=Phytophthora cactorum TaxID=29920 RepID=A0A8T1AFB5_9STRA|nr:hypothetical protein PC115_g23304 [Phytophthora cactorum]
MAWLERHEPWIDWRSKTLCATHFAPSGALVSHELTPARKQKRFWCGHMAESALVLDIGMSELVSNEVAIVHERGSQDVRGAARYPRSGADLVSDPLLRRASVTSMMLDDVSNVTSSEVPQDCCEQLYTLVNGVAGEIVGDISLGSLPAVNALLELDEISIAGFEELNSSSDVDEAALEDTKKALSAMMKVLRCWKRGLG